MSVTAMDQEMKALERATDQRIDGSAICLIRLDGVGFSKYTRQKCFERPFSNQFAQAMIETSRALAERFNPHCVYTSSDEITIILKRTYDEEVQQYKPYIYNGRVQKLASISAATATAAFNDAIQRLFASSTERPTTLGVFDARVFTVPDEMTALRNIQWRSSHDAARNSFSRLAQHFLGAKKLHHLTKKQLVSELQSRYKVSWEDLDDHYRYGTLLRKEAIMKECIDHKTGQPINTLRRLIVQMPLTKDLVSNRDGALLKALFS